MIQTKTGKMPIPAPTISQRFATIGHPAPPVPPGKRTPREMPEAFSLLFLGIDGVLNSLKTYTLSGCYPYPNENYRGYAEDMDSYIDDVDAFDFLSIGLVNLLCKATNSYIVLTSTWRNSFNKIEDVVGMMEEIGLDYRYILGRTDNLGKIRGDEVQRSLNIYNGELSSIETLRAAGLMSPDVFFSKKPSIVSHVIIDDINDFNEDQRENLVLTTELDGLTLDKTLEAGIILANDPLYSVKKLKGLPDTRGDKRVH